MISMLIQVMVVRHGRGLVIVEALSKDFNCCCHSASTRCRAVGMASATAGSLR